jgi:glycerophosphoryl diester phosphodiesterase
MSTVRHFLWVMKPAWITSLLLLVPAALCFAEPLIIAHRGSSASAPENTIPAFELAWEQQADGIEADFLLTKDGHIVCFHDKDTKRITGKKLLVKNTPLSKLRQLDVGSWKGEQYKGTRIPTIAEVLATVPDGKKIYIEIKCGEEIVTPLLREIEASTLTKNQIVIICFKAGVLKAIKQHAPHLQTSWLCNIKKDKSGKVTPTHETICKTLEDIHANGFSSSHQNINLALINKVNEAEIMHHVWTVNDPAIATRFSQWGTASITTDKPALIKNAIKTVPAP